MKRDNLEEIHNSLINGQRRQMVEQIDNYGLYDFWNDYQIHLTNLCPTANMAYHYFSDCVISYHRITNR